MEKERKEQITLIWSSKSCIQKVIIKQPMHARYNYAGVVQPHINLSLKSKSVIASK